MMEVEVVDPAVDQLHQLHLIIRVAEVRERRA